MRPVSLALDQLQSEEKAFIGILLPTLAMAIKKLRDVLVNNEVAVCVPLVTVLIDSIKKRFHEVPHCTEYELAAAIHPYFRLSWLSWLYNNDEVAAVEKESQLEMRLINVVERQSRSHESSGEEVLEEDPNDDFFGSLFDQCCEDGGVIFERSSKQRHFSCPFCLQELEKRVHKVEHSSAVECGGRTPFFVGKECS